MLGRRVNVALTQGNSDYPWGDTLPIFHDADWRTCNLECVISDHQPQVLPEKQFHFRSDRKNVDVLEAARIDAVSIANNHVLDFGPEALLDTLDLLDAVRVAHAGAGQNLEQARRPAITTAGDGTRVGLIACTDNEPGWEAGERRPGLFYVPTKLHDQRVGALLARALKVRELVDLLVVSLHWGPNWGYAPPPDHPPLARALIEAGADIVFGHSAHVFRGVEVYRARPIIYSAGDFIDDYAVEPSERNDQSMIFTVEVDRGIPTRVRLRPTVIEHLQVRLAGEREVEQILDKMSYLCASFGTSMSRQNMTGTIELS